VLQTLRRFLVTTGPRIFSSGLLNARTLNTHFHRDSQPSFPYFIPNFPLSFSFDLEVQWKGVTCSASRGVVHSVASMHLSGRGELLLPTLHLDISPVRRFARIRTQGISRDHFHSTTSIPSSPDRHFQGTHLPRIQRTTTLNCFCRAGFVAKGESGRTIARAVFWLPLDGGDDGRAGHPLKSGQRVEIEGSKSVGTLGGGYDSTPGSFSELDGDSRSSGS